MVSDEQDALRQVVRDGDDLTRPNPQRPEFFAFQRCVLNRELGLSRFVKIRALRCDLSFLRAHARLPVTEHDGFIARSLVSDRIFSVHEFNS
jgi:hypothetical protein